MTISWSDFIKENITNPQLSHLIQHVVLRRVEHGGLGFLQVLLNYVPHPLQTAGSCFFCCVYNIKMSSLGLQFAFFWADCAYLSRCCPLAFPVQFLTLVTRLHGFLDWLLQSVVDLFLTLCDFIPQLHFQFFFLSERWNKAEIIPAVHSNLTPNTLDY